MTDVRDGGNAQKIRDIWKVKFKEWAEDGNLGPGAAEALDLALFGPTLEARQLGVAKFAEVAARLKREEAKP